jgi:microcompartment protein CcmK/EutM
MRLCVVRGSVVLSSAVPSLRGKRLIIAEPITAERLRARTALGGGKALIVADQLNPGQGQIIGVVEGRTAANPYAPDDVPVDAYCALIVQNLDYRPPETEKSS